MKGPTRTSEEKYTYEDFKSWDDDALYELIYGRAVLMPSPNLRHQRVSKYLFRKIDNYLLEVDSPCEALSALALKLPEPGEGLDKSSNVLIPDIFVNCDPSRTSEEDGHVNGAPEWVNTGS